MSETMYNIGDRVFFAVPERYKCSIEEYRKMVTGKVDQSSIRRIEELVNSMVTICDAYNSGETQYYKIKEFDAILFHSDWFGSDRFEPADDDAFMELFK